MFTSISVVDAVVKYEIFANYSSLYINGYKGIVAFSGAPMTSNGYTMGLWLHINETQYNDFHSIIRGKSKSGVVILCWYIKSSKSIRFSATNSAKVIIIKTNFIQ